MAAPKEIVELVERFESNREAYKSGHYNETQVRREFVDPLFKALGWDIDNEQGFAEAYKDVIHEDAIKVGGTTRAPDYSFRIGGQRKFFLETKKPSVDIKEDIHPAFQLRRYAWTAKLPLSILTDFEEFSVYDCTVKPDKKDMPSKGRILYLTCRDYLEQWDEIAAIFSKNAILKGSFDKYARDKRGKRGTAQVDSAFLEEIAGWREILARNIALRNPDLDTRDLNYAVQATVNRIVFLRICEDRGIERLMKMEDLLQGERVYPRLSELFRRADERYNSGIFHFEREPGRENPDTLSLRLNIDDKPLKDIIRRLYYPDSPYEFSVLPAEILGQVYEQFLGKVIRLTDGHRAVVEDKPEVKKAGGVKYTPAYIVDYIVKNTLGPTLEGKTPSDATKISVLDPACGSGSFLIVAYQHLLDWHREWYVQNLVPMLQSGLRPSSVQIRHMLPGIDGASKGRKKDRELELPVFQGRGGEWRLTTAERKRILLNNIYGVDIDRQAVEVTKLSLLLKVLEGENEETISKQLTLFSERALPDLSKNIKCGNSLIGWDILEDNPSLGQEEIERINPFDWDAEFPEIMQDGGFHVVIGNPPYVFGRDWKALNISNEVKAYLGKKFTSSPYQLDMFSIFIEKASQLCHLNGRIGQIVPNVWLNNAYSSSTRKFILQQANDLCVIIPPANVFSGLTVDTIVYKYQKASGPGGSFRIKAMRNGDIIDVVEYSVNQYLNGEQPISTVLSNVSAGLVYRVRENYPKLENFAKITRGVHSYRIGGYGKTAFGNGPQTSRDVEERPYHSKTYREGYRPFVRGRDLHRFTPVTPTEFVKYGEWLAEPRSPEFFQGYRIYSRKILSERLLVTLEANDSVSDQQVYITLPTKNTPSAPYLAGVLGSKFISFFIRSFYNEVNDAFPQIKVGQLKSLPIPFKETVSSKATHDNMTSLVEQMLSLNKYLQEARTPHEKTALLRQIEATDRQIDALVYELYGLTEEEIKIVEKSQSNSNANLEDR